jgi:hypothetical protein
MTRSDVNWKKAAMNHRECAEKTMKICARWIADSKTDWPADILQAHATVTQVSAIIGLTSAVLDVAEAIREQGQEHKP